MIVVFYSKRLPHSRITSHLSTLGYRNGQLGLVIRSRGNVLNLPHDQEAVQHPPEDDVLVVQEVTLGAGDEELATVGIPSGVGH